MSTRTATSRIEIATDALLSHELTSGVLASANIGQDFQQSSLSSGTSSQQASRAWESKTIAISSGGSQDLDLREFTTEDIGSGAARDGLGQRLILDEIVCLVIRQTSGPGRLEVMPSAPNNGIDWIPSGYATVANGGALKSGGVMVWYEDDALALAIEANSSSVLRLGALNGNVTAEIYIIGRHGNEDDEMIVINDIASLRLSGTGFADGDVAFVKRYRTDGDGGGGHFYLDTSASLGASADNGGTVISSTGGTSWYWQRLPTGGDSDYDVRKWGAIVSLTAGNETVNDAATAAMISSNQPIIYLPGPIVIKNQVLLTDQSINIKGTNQAEVASNAGGFIVTGTGTAQSDAVVRIVNNEEHRIDTVRFYGHTDNPTTLCELGVLIAYDSTAGPAAAAGRVTVNNCMFANAVKDVTCFKNGIKTVSLSAEGGTEHVLVDKCTFKKYTEKGVWIQNTQSVRSVIRHCRFDGRTNNFVDFAEHGVFTRSICTIEDCDFNRLVEAVEVNQAATVTIDRFHAEHCRTLIHATSENAKVSIRDGKFIFTDDANAGEPDPIVIQNMNIKYLSLDNVQFIEEAGYSSLRPRMEIGNHPSTVGVSTMTFHDCDGLKISDFDGGTSHGDPSQRDARLDRNDHGVWFDFRDSDTPRHQDRFLPGSEFNLDVDESSSSSASSVNSSSSSTSTENSSSSSTQLLLSTTSVSSQTYSSQSSST